MGFALISVLGYRLGDSYGYCQRYISQELPLDGHYMGTQGAAEGSTSTEAPFTSLDTSPGCAIDSPTQSTPT